MFDSRKGKEPFVPLVSPLLPHFQPDVALKKSDEQRAFQLTEQGYEKQFEEVIAANEKQALARFADIRREKEIDQHNFLAGAIAMPLIGVMTAAATSLFKKKKDASKT